eukprot:1158469-Pelagomonas_calceolata.AAC.10
MSNSRLMCVYVCASACKCAHAIACTGFGESAQNNVVITLQGPQNTASLPEVPLKCEAQRPYLSVPRRSHLSMPNKNLVCRTDFTSMCHEGFALFTLRPQLCMPKSLGMPQKLHRGEPENTSTQYGNKALSRHSTKSSTFAHEEDLRMPNA